MTIHGFKEDFKEEEREKEKEKEEKEKEKEVGDFSDQETKEKETEREKGKVILLKMKAIGQMKNGKDMKMKIGMKAIGPMKMRQHGNPKAGMNGKSMTNTDFSKEKERKERKEKERKVMDLQIKEKDKVMGNYVNPSHFFSTRNAASSSTFVSECLWFLCDTFTRVLDISQGDREWRAEYGA